MSTSANALLLMLFCIPLPSLAVVSSRATPWYPAIVGGPLPDPYKQAVPHTFPYRQEETEPALRGLLANFAIM